MYLNMYLTTRQFHDMDDKSSGEFQATEVARDPAEKQSFGIIHKGLFKAILPFATDKNQF